MKTRRDVTPVERGLNALGAMGGAAAMRNEVGRAIAKAEEAAGKIGSKFPPGGTSEQLVTPEGVTVNVPKPRATLEELATDPMAARGETRINIRKGDPKIKGSGLDYALKNHLGSNRPNKSQFNISRAEIEALLKRRDVIQSPVEHDPIYKTYIRQADVGQVIGHTPLKKGGHPTSVITIITDDAGNLVNVFPGTKNFEPKLP